MIPTGELAAIFTSFCWALSAVGFTNATQAFGAQVTNRIRVALAFIALIAINTILYKNPLPLQAESWRWVWLSLSGIIGLAIGDSFLFSAYKAIGPRLGLLLLSLAPVFGAGIAWVVFAEQLNLVQILGIVLTLAGVSWVVVAKPNQENGPHRLNLRGVIYGIMAALGQAGGLVLSRQGMAGSFPPFAGSLIRMSAAGLILWGITFLRGEAGHTITALRAKPSGVRWAMFGALFGPVLGVSASLLSIQHTEVGIASTLMALPPLFMLPISRYVYKETLEWKSILGTTVAILGVAILFLG
jgi:drug/metabolite transporter (DMT)-like permease